MQIRPHINALRTLSALLLTLLLAAQVVQVAHAHADHVDLGECQVCTMDGGQAAPAPNHSFDTLTPINRAVYPSQVQAPVTADYDVNVRGPPAVSL